MWTYNLSELGRWVTLEQSGKLIFCLRSHRAPHRTLPRCPCRTSRMGFKPHLILFFPPELVLVSKKSYGRVHLYLETLKFFNPSSFLSLCP